MIVDIPEDEGLIFACRLDGDGKAELIGWAEVESWNKADGPIWIHLDHSHIRVQAWLREKSGLTETTVEALIAQDTRPRVFQGRRGLIAILRGVNLNPGSDAEDMIDLRIWSEGQRVITLRRDRLQTARDVLSQLVDESNGPETISELFVSLIVRLNERIAPTIEHLSERVDALELAAENMQDARETRHKLLEIRTEAVKLRRYLAPQRVALGELLATPPKWAKEEWGPRFRETSDMLVQYIEELDAIRERVLVIKDDIANQLAEATNKTLYALAVLSGIFLPLAFLTGLLGINIGGMPGVDDDKAFGVFCGLLAGLTLIEIAIFRRLKWL